MNPVIKLQLLHAKFMQIFAGWPSLHFHYTVQEDEWHQPWAKQEIPEPMHKDSHQKYGESQSVFSTEKIITWKRAQGKNPDS